mmetsp:Transcript_17731/g.53361  ORF Transcript_17731/g.53361 Transcript_17731/m.53361 type:complete len:294 (+) Transcript_17731:2035-2916(+)
MLGLLPLQGARPAAALPPCATPSATAASAASSGAAAARGAGALAAGAAGAAGAGAAPAVQLHQQRLHPRVQVRPAREHGAIVVGLQAAGGRLLASCRQLVRQPQLLILRHRDPVVHAVAVHAQQQHGIVVQRPVACLGPLGHRRLHRGGDGKLRRRVFQLLHLVGQEAHAVHELADVLRLDGHPVEVQHRILGGLPRGDGGSHGVVAPPQQPKPQPQQRLLRRLHHHPPHLLGDFGQARLQAMVTHCAHKHASIASTNDAPPVRLVLQLAAVGVGGGGPPVQPHVGARHGATG